MTRGRLRREKLRDSEIERDSEREGEREREMFSKVFALVLITFYEIPSV